MSRWTRPSIASSLCALSLLATSCGESNTHSARKVRDALARRGFGDLEILSTEPPVRVRTKVAAAELRIDVLLSYDASRLAGLAAHKTARADVVGDGVSVLVAHDPADAAWTAGLFRRFSGPSRLRPRRIDNLIVIEGDNPRVAAALDDLH